jgi:hypothetical protein
MSLVISSTTDDQAAVNAAAGITEEAPATEETQEQDATPTKPPEQPEEPEPDEDEGDEEEKPEQPPAQPKKKGGFQRKIESQQKQIDYLRRVVEEQNALAGQRKPVVEPQRPLEPPRQDQYESYEDFTRATVQYEVAQARAEEQEKYREWQAQERQRQVAQSWQERVGSFKQQAADFDDVLAAADHIQLHPALQQTLMQSDKGPELAYALAKDPERLEFIASLHPEIGRYELARLQRELKTQPPQQQKQPPISKAPEPIVPVARGANGSTPVAPDQMALGDYIRWRERDIAARNKGRRAA